MKRIILPLLALGLLSWACVKVDNSLGKGLVDNSLIYDTYTVEFPLTTIRMDLADDLSGYSDSHVTIGAIRDDVFGLTTRSSAFSLIPSRDTIDLGKDPVAISLDVYFSADTVSCLYDSDARILQNIYVYELTDTLNLDNRSTNKVIPYDASKRITNGIPVYNGEGPLTFEFTQEYAQKYVDALVALGPALYDRSGDSGLNRYSDYIKAVPGIYICTDAPAGNGGRINIFDLSCLSVSSNYYTINGNLSLLKVNSEWDGVRRDSTFILVPGEPVFYDENTYLNNNTKFYQYAFNRTTHETVSHAAAADILVEGGGGLKPVIPALELHDKTVAEIEAKGGDASKAIIAKATILLPYEMPADWKDMRFFPSILSPTIRTAADDGSVNFAGLTDASVDTENQGSLDRSNLCYAPDITYHLQEILSRTDLATATDADIWLLTVRTEKVASASGSAYDNDYYQQLLYASYYNSLYGGYGGYGYGYGYGYGGYGGYGGYSNYYNYAMLASYMNSTTQQKYTTTTELDKDRFYRAVLNGPASSRKPVFRVTFSLPKD